MAPTTEDQSYTSGMPWWVRAVVMLGVPSAIALFLVWFIASKQVDSLQALPRIEQKLDTHIEATKSLETAIERGSEEQHEHGLRIEGYMRLICVQSAATIEERNTCLSVR